MTEFTPRLADAERLYAHAFIANAHATEAQNAAGRVVINGLGPFFFGPVIFFLDEAAVIRAVAENHVLQFALAAFVAHGTIQRMIRQQKFQHALCARHELAAYRCGRSFLRRRSACRPSAVSGIFPLPPDTCGMRLAVKARGNSRMTALQCRCGAPLRSPACPARTASRAR